MASSAPPRRDLDGRSPFRFVQDHPDRGKRPLFPERLDGSRTGSGRQDPLSAHQELDGPFRLTGSLELGKSDPSGFTVRPVIEGKRFPSRAARPPAGSRKCGSPGDHSDTERLSVGEDEKGLGKTRKVSVSIQTTQGTRTVGLCLDDGHDIRCSMPDSAPHGRDPDQEEETSGES